MVNELNIGIAFIAGLVSFFAPCVVVLVPAFLSHLAGSSLKNLESDNTPLLHQTRKNIIINTLFFIVGFTLVFLALGASIGFLSQFIRGAQEWLQRIGGALIILFGLVTLNIIRIPWLQREYQLTIKTKEQKSKKAKIVSNYITSLAVGAAFAIGWTPCVGPVLAGILVLAGTGGSVGAGVLLLLAYAIGLMVPFIITALFTVRISRFLTQHNKFLKWVNIVAGVLLIILGILVFTDNFARLVGSLYFLEV